MQSTPIDIIQSDVWLLFQNEGQLFMFESTPISQALKDKVILVRLTSLHASKITVVRVSTIQKARLSTTKCIQ